MKRKPNFVAGDTVEYKAGKRGHNYNFDNGKRFVVKVLLPPEGKGEWGGWTVVLTCSNMDFPVAWFRKV